MKKLHDDDYPPNWYAEILAPGVRASTAAKWGGDGPING